MKTRLHWVLPEARIAGGQPRPLHVRLDVDDGAHVKLSLGVQVRPDHINWQLCLTPGALAEILERVAWATRPGPESTPDSA